MTGTRVEAERFFDRIAHSLTLQMKIADFAPTDLIRLWRMALNMGYTLDYAEFLAFCRTLDRESVVPALWRIIEPLQHRSES